MYKIIIVDDEYFSAKLLEKYIEEFTVGFEVSEIFSDAAEAVKYLASGGKTDVIMTDIRMRKMSGVQLAKYVNVMKINAKVIFVSAYADFEYAKEAMSYNVFGYLLKTVDIDELKKLMDSLKAKLDSEKKSGSEDIDIQRELFTENLLMGKFKNEAQIIEEFNKCSYSGNFENFRCSVLKIMFPSDSRYSTLIKSEGMEKIETALTGVIKCVINSGYVNYMSHENNMFYITILDDSDEHGFKSLQTEISEIFGIDIKIEIAVSKTLKEFYGQKAEEFGFLKRENDESLTLAKGKTKIIGEAVEFINSNLANAISRDTVADYVRLTPAHFGRLFKEVMKTSFSDYVYQKRMETAENLLKQGISTTDVCARIGVIDERQFRRSFKLFCGMSPAEYRKANMEKE